MPVAVPAPVVLLYVTFESTAVPPIIRGTVADVVMVGVMTVGEVSTTNFVPVPVCEAMLVALPTEVIGPVRFALVVTVAALPVVD
jgi:hypothetical protein